MKYTALLFLLVIMIPGLNAAVKSTDNFVIIGNNTYYCDEVRVGRGFTRIYINGRQYCRVPSNLVNAYAEKGNFYEYLPVLNTHKDTTGWAFMQFVTSRDGYRLYRYCSNCLKYDPVTGIIEPIRPVFRYYIFKSGKFVSVTNDQNEQEQLASFGIKSIK